MVYNKTSEVKEKLIHRERSIIKAAKEVFAEKGFQKTSIKDIARFAGIATGTFYLYFKNKESFFEVLVEEVYQELLMAIKTERKKVSGTLNKLQISMEVCVNLCIKERSLAKIMLIQAPNASPIINTQLSALQDGLVQLALEDLNEAVSAGTIPPQNTHIAALSLVGGFHNLLLNWLKSSQPFDLHAATQDLFQHNLYGLLRVK